MDVVLIGLPGSGKSAVGRRLAARHGAEFIDLDEVIEREAGVRIPEIFEQEGEHGFRAREREAQAKRKRERRRRRRLQRPRTAP